MKKFPFIAILLASIIILAGASVWEGAAAVSMDFPESGLYAATNSFPRNTIVDLTNLETGKTVRVIVAAGLDSPGLLALVSREAAEAIGLRSRTIGRIRMVAPSDPIAFSRFSDEYRSGDPDYDPRAAVEGVYGSGIAAPGEGSSSFSAVPEDPPSDPLDSTYSLRSEPDSSWNDVLVYPADGESEFSLNETFLSTVPDTSNAGAIVPDYTVPTAPESPKDTVPPPVVIVVPEPVYTVPAPGPVYAAPAPSEPGSAPQSQTPPGTGYSSDYTYTLVPAEERPPKPAYAVPGSAVPQIFSVPAVSELERGKYYLQLGAYSHTGTVEQELCKIERGYPLAVQSIVLSGKPVYRVLIGPVNQGEAGALLKKFQARGYKDAFVRRAN